MGEVAILKATFLFLERDPGRREQLGREEFHPPDASEFLQCGVSCWDAAVGIDCIRAMGPRHCRVCGVCAGVWRPLSCVCRAVVK